MKIVALILYLRNSVPVGVTIPAISCNQGVCTVGWGAVSLLTPNANWNAAMVRLTTLGGRWSLQKASAAKRNRVSC
jgi:hypothetical protein